MRLWVGWRLAGFVLLALMPPSRPAMAAEVSCIESSRYEYLYKLFDDDQTRFAAYFNLDPAKLPPPWACRAALVSGPIAGKDDDAVKLIGMIAVNDGWLDTIYLDSPGGNVIGGLNLAWVIRDFWLKTRVLPAGDAFVYDPDFGPPATLVPPDPGRVAYDKAAATVATRQDKPHWPFCASACTYLLAAGVDRRGVALVHRPRIFDDESLEKRATAEVAENLMMRLYTKMDVGDAFMAKTRATATQSASPIVVSRYPRFISDALLDHCKSDLAQLDDLGALLRFALSAPGNGLARQRDDELRRALSRLGLRRRAVVECVSARNEKERRAAFVRYCPSGCSVRIVEAMIQGQVRGLDK